MNIRALFAGSMGNFSAFLFRLGDFVLDFRDKSFSELVFLVSFFFDDLESRLDDLLDDLERLEEEELEPERELPELLELSELELELPLLDFDILFFSCPIAN